MGAELHGFGATAEGEFLFEIDEQPTEECLTALGGVPLFVRTACSLDVPGSVKRNLAMKQRDRGFDEATYIESFLVLNAVGGECLEDFDCLREDRGLAAMLGHEVPSPEAARKFLYQFHNPQKIEQAQRELPVDEVSYVPEESTPLRGLAQVNQDVVRELARRCAGERIATIDMDATIIESWKREAKATYEGNSGYQPMVALWAEMNVVVAEEFRDGNVPALKDPLRVAQRGFEVLPGTIQERYFRGDSACDEEELLSWLRDEKRAWAGLCPGNNRSAGKSKSSHTTGGNPWLRSALVEGSWAASTKRDCFLKEKFWRIVSKTREHKKGPALIAVAHTMLRLVYEVLSTGKPYIEHGPPPLDERQKQRISRHHVRRPGKLGIAVYSTRAVRLAAANADPSAQATP